MVNLEKRKKCVAMVFALLILLAIIMLIVHLTITMFTPTQAVALFIMVLNVPLAIAVVRSALYLKKL